MKKAFSVILSLMMLTVISGCSLTFKFTIDEPTVSGFTYSNVEKKPVVMKVIDQRDDRNFTTGGVIGFRKVNFIFENVDNPVEWLSKGMEKEFVARGVPMQIIGKNANAPFDMTLTIKKYKVVASRVSGFSPWEAYHLFLGQVSMGGKSCTIPAFFFDSKFPAWSMEEINKPCLSIPMSIMVKEIVSKINRCVFNYSTSDEALIKLESTALQKVNKESEAACFSSIELGGTNNPAAMVSLQNIAETDDSIARSCSFSAMGTLGAEKQIDYFTNKYKTLSSSEKIILLKSIGDIGSAKALDFLKSVKSDEIYTNENGAKYCVDLYLAK